MAWRVILDGGSERQPFQGDGFGKEAMETQVGSLGFTGDSYHKGEVTWDLLVTIIIKGR